MLAALALILPLGLASAVGPMMLTEQTVLLAGPGGRRLALGYAAGGLLATAALVAAILLFGRAISLPSAPRLDAGLDLAIGAALLASAGVIGVLGRLRHGARPAARQSFATGAAGVAATFAFGIVAVATNLTGIPLIAAGAKEISASGIDAANRLILAVVLTALGSAPAWVPLALTRIAPGAGERFLEALGNLLRRYGRAALVVLVAGAGLYFVARGLARLLA